MLEEVQLDVGQRGLDDGFRDPAFQVRVEDPLEIRALWIVVGGGNGEAPGTVLTSEIEI